jgi:ribosomal protein S18 acetylase RimI-like enzyme
MAGSPATRCSGPTKRRWSDSSNRVEDEYQRRGLARMLLTNGLDRLGRKGARRLKVGFETDAARDLYLSAGFVQTSIDRLLIRPAPRSTLPQGPRQ